MDGPLPKARPPKRSRYVQIFQLVRLWAFVSSILPGLVLSSSIGWISIVVHAHFSIPLLSPVIVALSLGFAFRHAIGTPDLTRPGIDFSLRPMLRAAIVLLGLQLTIDQIVAVGFVGISLILATMLSTYFFTRALGRALGVEAKLAELIAAGTSICGASAIVAVNTVIKARDEAVAYAIACITVCGCAAMILYPLLADWILLQPHAYGLWAGISIHEIAQVVGASYQDSAEASEYAVIAKLARVVMLAPVILLLGLRVHTHAANGMSSPVSTAVPWFVYGFIAMIGVNSAISLPDHIKAFTGTVTGFLFTTALAAMGLGMDGRQLGTMNLRPFVLALGATLFIAGASLMSVMLAT